MAHLGVGIGVGVAEAEVAGGVEGVLLLLVDLRLALICRKT